MHEMPGQHGSLKSRKRKSSSEVKSRRKASTTKRRCIKSSKTQSATASSSPVSGHSKAVDILSTRSHISCECHHRRCSASPEPEGPDGKENKLRKTLDLDCCRLNSPQEKQEETGYEETDKDIFPDDDSNQILPVEQFFGNLDIVQDFPEGPSATSASVRRKHRRRHYYAREDSDEEEADFIATQQDDRGFSDE